MSDTKETGKEIDLAEAERMLFEALKDPAYKAWFDEQIARAQRKLS